MLGAVNVYTGEHCHCPFSYENWQHGKQQLILPSASPITFRWILGRLALQFEDIGLMQLIIHQNDKLCDTQIL